MTAQLAPTPVFKAWSPNGEPLAYGRLTTYAAGSTTKQATYVDSTQTKQNTNPIILDAFGQCALWLDPTLSYKFVLTDQFGNTMPGYPVDNIQGQLFILYPQTPAEAAAGVIPTNYNYPSGNILRYGGNGNGSANNLSAFQQAASVCEATGLALIVPAGNYLIDTTGGTITCSYLSIQGTGVIDGSATPTAAGSVLSIVGTANSPFTIGPGVTFDGIAIYYPNQVDSATPTVYPPTIITSLLIAGAINFVGIQNCTVFNAYRFFVDTDPAGGIGHVFVDNNAIYGILTCFEIAYNAEVIHFTDNDFTFGIFLAATESGLRSYTRANGSVLKCPKTDGFTCTGNLFFGYLNGLYFNTSASLCQLTNIEGNFFDQVLNGIIADGTGNISGEQIIGNSFVSFNTQNHTLAGHAITISTSGTIATETLTITGNNFSTCTADQIITTGTAVRLFTITANQFNSWGAYAAAGSFGGMNIGGTSTSYTAHGNIFTALGTGFTSGILGTCSSGNITGNVFLNCFNALNVTISTSVIGNNTSFGTGGTISDVVAGRSYAMNNLWDKASGTSSRPAFEALINAAQTFNSGTYTAATFGTVSYDQGNNFSASTTFTAPQKGRYRFEWALTHDASGTAGDAWNIALVSSGSVNKGVAFTMVTAVNTVTGAADILMSDGDTVQLQVKRTGGSGNFVEVNDATLNYFCGSLIE